MYLLKVKRLVSKPYWWCDRTVEQEDGEEDVEFQICF